jgi:post-segregation antitoxin (ccd killing protein)
MSSATRNRGPRWSSTKQADRGRPGRMVYLPRDLHAALDRLRDAKANVSAIAEEALRAHPKVAAELERLSESDPSNERE